MKKVSTAVLAAALIAGGASVAVTPAFAAKEKKAEKEQPLKLSNEVRTPAAAAQAALANKDTATAEPLVAQVESLAKSEDERYIAQALRLNVEAIKIGNGGATAGIKAPLDALLANPRTPAADLPRYAYQRGVIAANEKDYQTATANFERAQQLGYQDPNLPLQLVQLRLNAGDTAGGMAALEKVVADQVAAGKKPDEALYRLAIAKTNGAKQNAQTLAWIDRYLASYPTQKNWRDMVVFYGIQPQSAVPMDKGQKIDLYRLLRSGKALADQYDYEIYATWANDLGLPWEAKSVIQEGRAAGKIPANSENANSALAAANKFISNEGSLDSLTARAKTGTAKVAASTADAQLGSGNYPAAIELYRIALQKGGVDADAVNTRLGIALAQSGDKAGAQAAFAAVKGAPRTDIAKFWTRYLENPPVA